MTRTKTILALAAGLASALTLAACGSKEAPKKDPAAQARAVSVVRLEPRAITGAQIRQALEQQWTAPTFPRILQVSRGFRFAWDSTRPVGERVLPESVTLHGSPIEGGARYRITVNDFLASGGDGFSVFKDGTERTLTWALPSRRESWTDEMRAAARENFMKGEQHG